MSECEILVVDDDEDVREICSAYFRAQGYSILTAGNGEEALCYLRSGEAPPRLILLDWMMPVLDGEGFLKEKSLDERLASIPTVVVSASHQRLAREGVEAWLQKPISFPQLKAFASKYCHS